MKVVIILMGSGLCGKSLQSCPTVTPGTVALQAPLPMGFSRQEYWSGLPCSPLGDRPNPGTEPKSLMSPALTGGFFTTSITWSVDCLSSNSQLNLESCQNSATPRIKCEAELLHGKSRACGFCSLSSCISSIKQEAVRIMKNTDFYVTYHPVQFLAKVR